MSYVIFFRLLWNVFAVIGIIYTLFMSISVLSAWLRIIGLKKVKK